jgi:hypothetical protein
LGDETYTCCLRPQGDAQAATYSIIDGRLGQSYRWGGNNSKPTGRGTTRRALEDSEVEKK